MKSLLSWGRTNFCYLFPVLQKPNFSTRTSGRTSVSYCRCSPVRSNSSVKLRPASRKKTFTYAGNIICNRKLHIVDVSVTEDEILKLVGNKTAQFRKDCRALLEKSIVLGVIQPARYELSLLLCSDNYISSLNSKWRNKKEPTDVLSFAQEEQTLLGDIVISVETAYKQALERNYSLRDEIRVLLVHGFLHLLGYDHEESEQRRDEMEELENKLLSSLQWKGKGLVALS
ncbi:haloacid dehalogenase-like hydrolase family protein [Galdieria sulphuraria]|uniref:Haloacid dehalogenase-like hydrolase family protein n=1 Tax=Galdieria sulphuraria TaxID=130081 RepID=M2WZD9_GALSU|nr:haloacid dehalogenase-like hydrolase family protein [Galdieria sulphuraria]EME29445.1 haloacid dehalogenase-like hydrolase family protein [Galdieria sulphuraria]|eukprot:XP_005705965.1 haloacid dehalogenase-like hydrolase family protein [Galdieria sulphuraria]